LEYVAVFAVQFDQVESDQHRIVTVTLVVDKVEHRETVTIGDNGLAVDQERATR